MDEILEQSFSWTTKTSCPDLWTTWQLWILCIFANGLFFQAFIAQQLLTKLCKFISEMSNIALFIHLGTP